MRRHVAYRMRGLQWAVGASIVVAIAWPLVDTIAGQRSDTLYITLGDVRSRAAEVREIAHNAAAGRLTATYVHAQAGQLLRPIRSARDALIAKAGTRDGAMAGRAERLAERLLAVTESLAAPEPPGTRARAAERDLDEIVDELIRLEQQAKQRATRTGLHPDLRVARRNAVGAEPA